MYCIVFRCPVWHCNASSQVATGLCLSKYCATWIWESSRNGIPNMNFKHGECAVGNGQRHMIFFSCLVGCPTHINGASAVIWLQSWGCAMLPTGWGEPQFLSYVLLWILFSKVVVIRLKLTSHFWVPQTKANKCLHHAVSSAGCTSACWMAMCIPSSAGQKVFHHVSHESCNLRPIYSLPHVISLS